MAEQTLILVGNDKGGTISTLRLDGEKLSEVAVTEVGVGCSTFAIDRDRDLVYCAVKDPEPAILTLSLDRATGELTEIARRPVDDTLAYIGITPHALLGASYHGGWGASWQMVDGVVGPQVTRFENRNVHAAVPDPLNRNAYFTSLGDDLIAQFSISTDGELIELSEPKVKLTPGIGPRHLILSDDDRHAYLLTEFTGEVIRFDRSEGGRLSRAEEVWFYDGASGIQNSAYGWDPRKDHLIWGADLAIAGGGRWLLCTERTESTVGAVELTPKGHLSDHVVLSKVEAQPRSLTVAPGGDLVVVVGELSDHAGLYRLETDGRLTELDRIHTGKGPNWVRFA